MADEEVTPSSAVTVTPSITDRRKDDLSIVRVGAPETMVGMHPAVAQIAEAQDVTASRVTDLSQEHESLVQKFEAWVARKEAQVKVDLPALEARVTNVEDILTKYAPVLEKVLGEL